MANNVINKKPNILYNSIDVQRLTHPNQLTIQAWNNIINMLKIQANTNAEYIHMLHRWLIGEGQGDIVIPTEYEGLENPSFIEYITKRLEYITKRIEHVEETYLPLAGGTLTGGLINKSGSALSGIRTNFIQEVKMSNPSTSSTPDNKLALFFNNGKIYYCNPRSGASALDELTTNKSISQIQDGSIVVGKALNDKEGRNIADTYAEQNYVDSTFTAISNGNFVVGRARADAKGNNFIDTYATKSMLDSVKKILEDGLKEGSLVPLKAEQDGDGHNIVNTYQTKKVTGFPSGPLAGVTTVNEALTKLNSNALSTDNTLVGIQSGSVVAGKASKDADGNDIAGTYMKKTLLGIADGVATLDEKCKIPSSQLPSFVDDVLEYSSKSSFPTTGESGKIYLETSTNKSYRWSGSQYAEISSSIALGETSSTAYAGDKGKANREAIEELQQNKLDKKDGYTREEIDTKLENFDSTNYSVLVGHETVASEGGWQGTAVPNTGYVEKVYFNTALSTLDEFIAIASQITNYDDGGYIVLSNSDMSSNIILMYMPEENYYGILDLEGKNIYLAFGNLATDFGFEGWNPNLTNPFVFNSEAVSNLEGMSIGAENDKLSSLFSTTPFVQSSGGEKTTLYQMNADGTLNKDKPLSEEVGTMAIATSTNFNKSSDTQVPTTKAVQTMIDNALGNIESLLEAI